MKVLRRAVLIAGPTASGKSAMALARARQSGGVIVNADAMQIYSGLRIITARPSEQDESLAEHHLYGTISPTIRFSTGQWLTAVSEVIAATAPSRELIFVGGTGLYFDALTRGFAGVPEVSDTVIAEVSAEISGLDEKERMDLLVQHDPETAERLKVADPQRVIRALAVRRATGKPLSSFQKNQMPALLEGWDMERIVLAPERDILRERITRRFEAMFAEGAVTEVQAFLKLELDPSLPAMKAIGVREIADWLDGTISRDEAIALSVIATHQYAKRQRTWFRNRMGDWPRLGLGGAPL